MAFNRRLPFAVSALIVRFLLLKLLFVSRFLLLITIMLMPRSLLLFVLRQQPFPVGLPLLILIRLLPSFISDANPFLFLQRNLPLIYDSLPVLLLHVSLLLLAHRLALQVLLPSGLLHLKVPILVLPEPFGMTIIYPLGIPVVPPLSVVPYALLIVIAVTVAPARI